MKSKKFFGTLIMMLVLTMAVPSPALAAGTLTAETSAFMRGAAGTKTVKGKVYSTGATGWQKIGKKKYYFWPAAGKGHKKGEAATGWQTIGGKDYCFSDKGVLYTGKETVDGATFYFSKDGIPATGWQTINGKKYYFWPSKGDDHKKYEMALGLTKIGDKYYYFNKKGVLRTDGLIQAGTRTYYADKKGVLQKKWLTLSGKKYYFFAKTSGERKIYEAAKGVVKVDKVPYLFDEKGVMQTGLVKYDGKYYYADKNGVLQTRWQTIGGKSYYFFKKSFAAATGWNKLGSNIYYFSADGVKQTGWVTVGGGRYYLDSKGRMQTGWQTISGSKYYFFPKDQGSFKAGQAATGTVTIDKTSYTFESTGKLKSTAAAKPAETEKKEEPKKEEPKKAVDTGTTVTHDGITVPVVYTSSHGVKLYGKVDTTLPFGVQVLQSNLNYYEAAMQALKKQGKKWQYSVGGGINNFMWAFDDIVNYQPYRSSCCSSAQNWIVKDFGEKNRTDFCTVININEASTFQQLYESGKIRKGDMLYGVRYDNGRAIMHEYINYDFTTTFDTGHGSGGWHADASIRHSDPRKAVFDTFMNPMKTSFSYYGYKIRKIFRIRNDYVPGYYRNEKGILTKMPAGVKA